MRSSLSEGILRCLGYHGAPPWRRWLSPPPPGPCSPSRPRPTPSLTKSRGATGCSTGTEKMEGGTSGSAEAKPRRVPRIARARSAGGRALPHREAPRLELAEVGPYHDPALDPAAGESEPGPFPGKGDAQGEKKPPVGAHAQPLGPADP